MPTADEPCPDARRVLSQLAATNNGFPVYGYDFTYQNAPYCFPQMPNAAAPAGYFQPLAAHTSDIQFVFLGYHGGSLGVNLDQTSGQPRELQGRGGYALRPDRRSVDKVREDWQSERIGTSRVASAHAGDWTVPPAGHSKLGRNRRAIRRQLQVRVLGEPGSQPIDGAR